MNQSSKVMEQSPRRHILETKIHAVKLYTSGIPHPETSHLYRPTEFPYCFLSQCPCLVQVRSGYVVSIKMITNSFSAVCLYLKTCVFRVWIQGYPAPIQDFYISEMHVATHVCAYLYACIYVYANVYLYLYLCAVLTTNHQCKICTHMCTSM